MLTHETFSWRGRNYWGTKTSTFFQYENISIKEVLDANQNNFLVVKYDLLGFFISRFDFTFDYPECIKNTYNQNFLRC